MSLGVLRQFCNQVHTPEEWKIEQMSTLHCPSNVVLRSCTLITLMSLSWHNFANSKCGQANYYHMTSLFWPPVICDKQIQFSVISCEITHPSAFSHGSAGLLNKWSAQPPPLLILGAKDPQEYIWRNQNEIFLHTV